MLRPRQFSLFINKGNCLLFFLLFCFSASFSQKVSIDTSKATIDTTKAMKVVKYHSPKKAALFSAVLPGAGQVYNRKYWKVPILYAGFGGVGYLFMQNHKQFAYYRDIILNRHDTTLTNYIDPLPSQTDQQIFAYREDYRRYRDLCFIGMFAIYVLNVVDASVDAHMFTFDVSEDLTLNVSPYMMPSVATPMRRNQSGVTLTLKF